MELLAQDGNSGEGGDDVGAGDGGAGDGGGEGGEGGNGEDRGGAVDALRAKLGNLNLVPGGKAPALRKLSKCREQGSVRVRTNERFRGSGSRRSSLKYALHAHATRPCRGRSERSQTAQQASQTRTSGITLNVKYTLYKSFTMYTIHIS